MITGVQVRMARAALHWGLRALAKEAQVNVNSISRFEQGGDIAVSSARRIETALLENGVQLEENENRIGVTITKDNVVYKSDTDTDTKASLGRRIRELRDSKKLSNQDIADAMGIKVPTLQSIISGTIKRPPDHRLKKAADLFGVNWEELRALADREKTSDA